MDFASTIEPVAHVGTAISGCPRIPLPIPPSTPKNLYSFRKLNPPCLRLYQQDHSRGRGLTTTGQPTVSSLPQKFLPACFQWLRVSRIWRRGGHLRTNFDLIFIFRQSFSFDPAAREIPRKLPPVTRLSDTSRYTHSLIIVVATYVKSMSSPRRVSLLAAAHAAHQNTSFAS